MAAIVLAALALAGAPAATTVTCDPNLPLGGGTYIAQHRIVLGQTACAGLIVAALSSATRKKAQALNPTLSLPWIEGTGLLILLHEARHAAGDLSECHAQTFAMQNINALLDRYVSVADRREARRGVVSDDAVARAAGYYASGC